jgi:heme exporter protein A
MNGMAASEAIVAEQISKKFGNFVALNQIDLHLPEGGFLLLAGPNGAGKSTLLRLLAGISRPTSGQVLISGADPHRMPSARAAIGLLSHQILLYNDLTARENLLFFARLYDLSDREERVTQALSESGLLSRQNHRVRTFSRGMKQRLALVRATLHQPSVLLFDEPFTGLDQVATAALGQHLRHFKEQRRTCVLVTHRLETAVGLIDHLALLQSGRICHQGSWDGCSVEELCTLYAKHLDERT